MKKTVLIFLITVALCIAYMFYSVQNQTLWHDGPYVDFSASKDTMVVRQFCDDGHHIATMVDTIPVLKRKVTFENPCTKLKYELDTLVEVDTIAYEKVKKILVLGEITSKQDLLVNYLINNKVIDKNKHWIWKEGHLVFLGNVIHQGSQMTDYLWLIYQLEREAKRVGGKVHYILGKNELNLLDLFRNKEQGFRLLGSKQQVLKRDTTLNYEGFFGTNTFFGQWLRSKNSVVKINDILFAHGGVAPELAEKKFEINKVNQLIQTALYQNTNRNNVLYVNYNPINYNQYVGGKTQAEALEKLPEVLDFYAAKAMVTAGLHVSQIMATKSKKLYAIKARADGRKQKMEGLLIEKEGKRYRRLLFDGIKEKIKYSADFTKK